MRGTFDSEIKKALTQRNAPTHPKKKMPSKAPKGQPPAVDGDAEDMVDGGLDDNMEDAAGNPLPKKNKAAPFKHNRPTGFKPKA